MTMPWAIGKRCLGIGYLRLRVVKFERTGSDGVEMIENEARDAERDRKCALIWIS
jgi:hypothetical protein